jgi:hypothetical protein
MIDGPGCDRTRFALDLTLFSSDTDRTGVIRWGKFRSICFSNAILLPIGLPVAAWLSTIGRRASSHNSSLFARARTTAVPMSRPSVRCRQLPRSIQVRTTRVWSHEMSAAIRHVDVGHLISATESHRPPPDQGLRAAPTSAERGHSCHSASGPSLRAPYRVRSHVSIGGSTRVGLELRPGSITSHLPVVD